MIRQAAISFVALVALSQLAVAQAPGQRREWNGVFGKDHRVELRDYARTSGISTYVLRERLSSVHLLDCRGPPVTAVFVTPQIAITAAHPLIDRTTGARRNAVNCAIVVNKPYGPETHQVDPRGIITGAFRFGPIEEASQNDWAVVRVQSPIREITPVELPEDASLPPEGLRLTLVTGPQQNHPVHTVSTRLIDGCALRKMEAGETGVTFKTDCDTGVGASGGAYLTGLDSGTPVLRGIQSANRGVRGCVEFDAQQCFALGVPMNAAIREAIRKLDAGMKLSENGEPIVETTDNAHAVVLTTQR